MDAKKIVTEQEVDGRWIAEDTTRPGMMAYGATKIEAVLTVDNMRLRAENEALKWAQGEANAEKRRAEGLFNSNSTLRLQIADLTRERDEAREEVNVLRGECGGFREWLVSDGGVPFGIFDAHDPEGTCLAVARHRILALTTRAETAERDSLATEGRLNAVIIRMERQIAAMRVGMAGKMADRAILNYLEHYDLPYAPASTSHLHDCITAAVEDAALQPAPESEEADFANIKRAKAQKSQ